MNSIIIVLLLILVSLLLIYSMYKIYDKRGLYFSLVIMNIMSFILSFKIIKIFSLNINLGLIPMISIFTIIYIIITKYSIKDKKTILSLSLYTNIITSILILITNYFIPTVSETISISIKGTFEYNYKILILYPIIILLSQYIIIKLFNYLKELQSNIIINITLTYITTGLVYTLVFYLIAYINLIDIKNTIFMGVSSFLIGIIITLLNTLIIDLIFKKKVKKC
ncbi:ypdP [Clostridium sp. CAG:914]|jgi:uncharacterized PurR-regulated membrane protein YhhQ (DUF165 family)|nr:VUT family protein [Clostridium sp.]CDE95914.1 ypdP [Clostridium sp. CAG:914]